jgi:hypothetical protein
MASAARFEVRLAGVTIATIQQLAMLRKYQIYHLTRWRNVAYSGAVGTKQKLNRDGVLNIRKVPAPLMHSLRLRAVRDGKNIRQLVIDTLQQLVAKEPA